MRLIEKQLDKLCDAWGVPGAYCLLGPAKYHLIPVYVGTGRRRGMISFRRNRVGFWGI